MKKILILFSKGINSISLTREYEPIPLKSQFSYDKAIKPYTDCQTKDYFITKYGVKY